MQRLDNTCYIFLIQKRSIDNFNTFEGVEPIFEQDNLLITIMGSTCFNFDKNPSVLRFLIIINIIINNVFINWISTIY